jgi:prepilin-type processing-associated H-X9-DG protein
MFGKKAKSQSARGVEVLSKPRPHANPTSHRGVTFMEVLVVVGVLLLLLAMLFPGLSKAREQARRVLCQNNLRQWGLANQYYRDDNRDYLPTEGSYLDVARRDTWFNLLPPYLNAPAYKDVEGMGKDIKEFPELHTWICPSKNLSKAYKSSSGKNQFHYGMNIVLDGMNSPETPGSKDTGDQLMANIYAKKPNTVFMFDILENSPAGYQKHVGTTYHRGAGNVLFLDGSVQSFRDAEFVVNGDFKHPIPIWNNPHLYWGYTPKPK